MRGWVTEWVCGSECMSERVWASEWEGARVRATEWKGPSEWEEMKIKYAIFHISSVYDIRRKKRNNSDEFCLTV